MRRAKRRFLTRVFEALGPAVVRRGLGATGHQWNDGFLRHACGRLPEEALPIPTTTLRAGRFFGAWLGIAPGWVYELAWLWDRDEPAFRATAQDWLRETDRAHSEVAS
jgi:hypothetical protein